VAWFAPPPPLSAEAVYCFRLASARRADGDFGGRQGDKETRRQGEEVDAGDSASFSLSPPLLVSLSSSDARNRLRWHFALLRNRLSTALPATGIMFLLCFQEFELASLIGRPAWTVWLFDAQVGGLALAESLRRALFPVFCQLVVILPLVAIVARARALPTAAR